MVHPKTDDDERHRDGNDSIDDRRGNCRGGDQVAYSVFLKVLGQAGERVVQLAGGFACAVEVTKDQGNSGSVRTTSAGVGPASIFGISLPTSVASQGEPEELPAFCQASIR